MNYSWLKKHWIYNTLFFTIPSIWFSVFIDLLGKKIGLVYGSGDKIGELTPIGSVATAIVVLAIFLLEGLKNRYEYKTESTETSMLENKVALGETLEEGIKQLCRNKLACLRSVISSVAEGKTEPPEIFTNPEEQLSRMLEKVNAMMCLVASKKGYRFSESDFFITLAYNFPEDSEEWFWLEGTQESNLGIRELTKPGNPTTINYLLGANTSYYFNNKKEDAKINRQYMYDEQDETNASNNRDVGSIFCRKYEVQSNGQTYIRAILTISTTSKRFVRVESEDKALEKLEQFKENMATLTKESFGDQLTLELCFLYLYYKKHKGPKNPFLF